MFSVPILAMVACAAVISALIVLCIGRRNLESGLFRRAALITQAASIPSIDAAMPLINREIARARRHERPLSVAVLEIPIDELLQQIRIFVSYGYSRSMYEHRHTAQVARVVFALLGIVVRHALRDTDIVAYDPVSDHYILVSPESDRLGTKHLVDRVSEMLLKRTAVEAWAGIAVLPADGLTFDDLLNAAQAGRGTRATDVSRTEVWQS